jgi:hypothetical protein
MSALVVASATSACASGSPPMSKDALSTLVERCAFLAGADRDLERGPSGAEPEHAREHAASDERRARDRGAGGDGRFAEQDWSAERRHAEQRALHHREVLRRRGSAQELAPASRAPGHP